MRTPLFCFFLRSVAREGALRADFIWRYARGFTRGGALRAPPGKNKDRFYARIFLFSAILFIKIEFNK